MGSMNISMRFGIDADKNRKIEDREVVKKFDELKALDQDGDGVLRGREMEHLYFEYGEDVWLSGGRVHRIQQDNMRGTVELREVGLDPARIDLKMNFTL